MLKGFNLDGCRYPFLKRLFSFCVFQMMNSYKDALSVVVDVHRIQQEVTQYLAKRNSPGAELLPFECVWNTLTEVEIKTLEAALTYLAADTKRLEEVKWAVRDACFMMCPVVEVTSEELLLTDPYNFEGVSTLPKTATANCLPAPCGGELAPLPSEASGVEEKSFSDIVDLMDDRGAQLPLMPIPRDEQALRMAEGVSSRLERIERRLDDLPTTLATTSELDKMFADMQTMLAEMKALGVNADVEKLQSLAASLTERLTAVSQESSRVAGLVTEAEEILQNASELARVNQSRHDQLTTKLIEVDQLRATMENTLREFDNFRLALKDVKALIESANSLRADFESALSEVAVHRDACVTAKISAHQSAKEASRSADKAIATPPRVKPMVNGKPIAKKSTKRSVRRVAPSGGIPTWLGVMVFCGVVVALILVFL